MGWSAWSVVNALVIAVQGLAAGAADQTFREDLVARYNSFFPDISESDHDRYGFKTPADILAAGGSEAQKAIRIRDYTVVAAGVDLDGNPATADVGVYRDGSVISVDIRDGERWAPLFSIDIADTERCALTYPSDHYRVPIEAKQCRMIRAAHPAIEGLTSDALSPLSWIAKEDEEVLISAEDLPVLDRELIERANDAIGAPIMWDLTQLSPGLTYGDVLGEGIPLSNYPYQKKPEGQIEPMTANDLQEILRTMQIPGSIRDDEKGVTLMLDPAFAAERVAPAYGITVRRTDLRMVPTERQALAHASDDDQWQYAGVVLGRPVAVIGRAMDDDGIEWSHVLTTQVQGWIKADDIAITTKEELVRRMYSTEVLTAVVPRATYRGVFLEMGTRLMLAAPNPQTGFYEALVPRRGPKGELIDVWMPVPEKMVGDAIGGATFVKGAVPFSRANMVRLLFEYLGVPWGWGNERRGGTVAFLGDGARRELLIDCSGMMDRAFTAMGLQGIARNSWLQANQGNIVWQKGAGEARSLEAALDEVGTGAWLLAMKGHVGFFLGAADGRQWIFHSPGHFRQYSSDEEYVRIGDGEAVVSPLSLNKLDEKFERASGPPGF